MPTNALDQDALSNYLLISPFHRWLGLELVALREDGIDLRVKWRDEFTGNPNRQNTHGGIIAALIDISADYAIAAKLGRGAPTVDMRVDYHKGACRGDLCARARVIKLGSRLSTAEATVTDASGSLVASGRGVYFTGIDPAPPKSPGD